MKKRITALIFSFLLAFAVFALASCDSGDKEVSGGDKVYQIQNGGFETGDLTGWTVESGNAYGDDCVTTKSDFGFEDDGYESRIKINQTGNWHLYGRAFDDSYESQRVGSIRSQTFTLAGEGTITFKLAGGSLINKDGVAKPENSQCFLGVYRASDDLMIARQTNEYFVKHEEGMFDAKKYDPISGSLSTDNYNKYTLRLESYIGQELYIRIVDNDTDFYYGYFSADDIRTYSEAGPQKEGAVYEKIRTYDSDVNIPENDVANGGFETGSIAGWTVTEGTAFSHDGVNASPTYWKENIPYGRDGDYHYGYYNPTATGRMRSNTFILGGAGWLTYKLGGCSDNAKAYIRIMEVTDGGEERPVVSSSNYMYRDLCFPNPAAGLILCNMVQYRVDLTQYLGKKLFFEVVDENNAASDGRTCVVLDSVKAYYETKPEFPGEPVYDVTPDVAAYDDAPDSPHQVVNGTFETGDLTGWTVIDGAWGDEFVESSPVWWDIYPYNRKGSFHFATFKDEPRTGGMYSTPFEIGGSGFFTYLMGGNGGYMAVMKLENSAAKPNPDTDTEIVRFYNHGYMDVGKVDSYVVNNTAFLANMIAYKADLSDYIGETVYLLVVDESTTNWGHIELDSIITYYDNAPSGAFRDALVDKSGLRAAYDENVSVTKGDYTDASWNAFTDALTQAKEAIDNPRTHRSTVLQRKADLEQARRALTLKVPELKQDALFDITVRNGGRLTVDIFDYIYANGLTLAYETETDANGITLGEVEEGKFTVSLARDDTFAEGDVVGTVTVRVKYKGEEKLSFTLKVAVTNEAPFSVDENPKSVVDLYFVKNGKTEIDLNKYVHKVSDLEFVFVKGEASGDVMSNISLSAEGVLTVNNSATGSGTVVINVTGTDEIGSTEKSFTFTVEFTDTTAYRIVNGGFETGDLTGWTLTGGNFGKVTNLTGYWGGNISYDKDGDYLFTGLEGQNNATDPNLEGNTGSIRSTQFTLRNNSWISFKLGAAKNTNTGIRVITTDGTVLALFHNTEFGKDGKEGVLVQYKYQFTDLSADTLECYIEVFDDATGDWGLVSVDSIETYYDGEPSLANAYTAVNKK